MDITETTDAVNSWGKKKKTSGALASVKLDYCVF